MVSGSAGRGVGERGRACVRIGKASLHKERVDFASTLSASSDIISHSTDYSRFADCLHNDQRER